MRQGVERVVAEAGGLLEIEEHGLLAAVDVEVASNRTAVRVVDLEARPDQVVDVLALMGDSIDNVKGVPGIGEKGSRELINTYVTLDALLEKAAGAGGFDVYAMVTTSFAVKAARTKRPLGRSSRRRPPWWFASAMS